MTKKQENDINARIAQLRDMQEAHPEIEKNLQCIINHFKGIIKCCSNKAQGPALADEKYFTFQKYGTGNVNKGL